MKQEYCELELRIIKLLDEDVITASKPYTDDSYPDDVWGNDIY